MKREKIKFHYILFIGIFFILGYFILKNDPKSNTSQKVLSSPTFKKNKKVDVPSVKEMRISTIKNLKIDLTISELPTLEDIKELTEEEAHHTPVIILAAGKKIGQLIDKADSNENLRIPTLNFLKTCAEKENLDPVVRALCWKTVLTKINQWEVFLPIAEARVSDDVMNLAAQIL